MANQIHQPNPYVSSAEAAMLLGLSERSLLRLRDDQTLLPGTCWIRKNPRNPSSAVRYDVEACRRALIDATIAIEASRNLSNKNESSNA